MDVEWARLRAVPRRDGNKGVWDEDSVQKWDDVKRSAIDAALEKSGQNISQAAKALGISRRTLHRKLADPAKKGNVKR
jgi:ActR/RegA family two-component response regulator